MSDTMLLAVLRMPPKLWGKCVFDVAERHGYYRAAADRIEQDAARIRELEKEIQKWHWMMAWCKKNGLPPAQSWVWEKAEAAYQAALAEAKQGAAQVD